MFRPMRKKNKDIGLEAAKKLLTDEKIQASGRGVQMFEIEIEHLTGKEVQER